MVQTSEKVKLDSEGEKSGTGDGKEAYIVYISIEIILEVCEYAR